MAGLADYWPEHRQACVDVLCAYLRMPHSPNRSQGAPPEDRLKFDSARDVHDTVLRIITSHLRPGAEVSWRGLDFDFTGVALDDGDFSGVGFAGGEVSFGGAEFSSGQVSFNGAQFTSPVSFLLARFSGGQVDFSKVADWSQHPNFDGGGTQPSGVRLPTGSGTSGASEGPTSAGS